MLSRGAIINFPREEDDVADILRSVVGSPATVCGRWTMSIPDKNNN